jgi:putative DNA primase/helicase
MSKFHLDIENFIPYKINQNSRISESDFRNQSKGVLIDHGLVPPAQLDYSGEICRVPDVKKTNSKDGYYAIYLESRTIIGGNWRTGNKFQWTPSSETYAKSFHSPKPRDPNITKRDQKKNQKKCLQIWSQSKQIVFHPYLDKKQIKPYFARQLGRKLVIPLMNFDGTVCGLQYIYETSEKRFQKGSSTKGACCPIGMTVDPVPVLLCEGYATGCSLHEATNLPTVVAFSASNLPVVAKLFHQKFPATPLIICADNDYALEVSDGQNPGVKAAEEAHRLTGGSICIPQFSETIPGSDFNDIHVNFGLGYLRGMFSPFLKKGG